MLPGTTPRSVTSMCHTVRKTSPIAPPGNRLAPVRAQSPLLLQVPQEAVDAVGVNGPSGWLEAAQDQRAAVGRLLRDEEQQKLRQMTVGLVPATGLLIGRQVCHPPTES